MSSSLSTDAKQELILQAHDLLHKGRVSEAHEVLHKYLGVDNEAPTDHSPIQSRMGFDQAFRTACKKNGVRAMYVLIDRINPEGRARLLSGGDAHMCRGIGRQIKGLS